MSPAPTIAVNVKATEIPAIVDAMRTMAADIERITAERDQWEERYYDLLSKCGGTAP